ncbi:PucR family transcriptional regulator [Kineosporia sp. R_H_3]|uniref:PucR family transcriptional regulator n=1 Tax=Kineosporia sp. R_H_3 TaxID=1961848 RepID=UPI0018E91EF1|nr:PucR family transcriptional regulator [Kineosporia sp. R_H_3]
MPASPVPGEAGVARRLPRALRVREVLELHVLRGSSVLAGAAGLDRAVERVNVMEVPDILPWVKPHELLLTTGYPLRDDPGALVRLVGDLDERGLAALGVKLGRYLDVLPPQVIEEADRRGFPVIAVPETVAWDDVLEHVLTDLLDRQATALARSEEVHRALVQVVLDGGGLPELASGLVGLLGGAVVITTPDGRVLADGGDVDALSAAYDGRCFEGSGRLRTEAEMTGLTDHDGLAGNHVVVRVVAGRVDHGRIVAFSPEGSLTTDDVHTVERAATVAALAVTKQLAVRAVESKYQGDFLRDLLTGQVEPELAVTHAASLGWDVDRPVVVVVAELDPTDDDRPATGLVGRPAVERFAAAWQSVVRPRDPHAPVVGFHREVVAVLGAPPHGATGQTGPGVDRLVRDLVREVTGDGGGGRRSFGTGVSRVAATPAQIPAAYEQARTAVRVGRRMNGPGSVAHFDGLGVFRLLSLVEDPAELRSFAAETLGDLAKVDDDEARDLRRTLEVLLETNLNVAETARVMHFHYNTLRYRIAKLERMLGPFTHDAHLRLSLHLALQVLRMRGA